MELTGIANSNGSFFELRVIQAPKQGRANPPVPSHETKGSGLDNKRQKKDGKNVASDNNPTIGNGTGQKASSANQGKKIASPAKG